MDRKQLGISFARRKPLQACAGLVLLAVAARPAKAAEPPDLHLYKQSTCGNMIEGGILRSVDYLPCVQAPIVWKPAIKGPSEEFCKHSFTSPEPLANCSAGQLPTWTFDSSKGSATVNGSFVQ